MSSLEREAASALVYSYRHELAFHLYAVSIGRLNAYVVPGAIASSPAAVAMLKSCIKKINRSIAKYIFV